MGHLLDPFLLWLTAQAWWSSEGRFDFDGLVLLKLPEGESRGGTDAFSGGN